MIPVRVQKRRLVIRQVLIAVVAALVLGGFASTPPVRRALAAPTASRSPQSAADLIRITPALITRAIPGTFFGINYVTFWNPAEGSVASARALAQTPIRTVRFPGGAPTDWYDWQQPYYKGWSRTSPRDLWRYATSFGATHVIFGTNVQGHLPNPPGKSYSVNSPENAAAWVTSNKTSGIAADMEVGNEEDQALLHKADDPKFAAYTATFNAQAKAMHRADPRVRVLGPAGTNEYYWWALDELGLFLRDTGNRTGTGQVDGVSLHFYAGKTWDDAKSVAQDWLAPSGPWAAIQKAIREHDTRDLPVYLTEWNLGASDNHNAFTPTLGHALATTDLIGAFAQSGVAGEDYFTMHYAHGWGLFYAGQNSDKNYSEDRPVDSPTPTYYSMALWGHMGSRVVALSQSDNAANGTSAYATTRADGSLQVLVINKRETPRTVQIMLNGATPAGRHLYIYSLTSTTGHVDDLDAIYDGVRMPSSQHPLPGPRDAGIVRGATVNATIPAYSAAILDLRR